MKTAVMCIAKNEDRYIDEWMSYNSMIGFDDIYVYQNNWRYSGDRSSLPNVRFVECDGQSMQVPAYDSFLRNHAGGYDWVAFFDVDEFVTIHDSKCHGIKDALESRSDVGVMGVPWRMFGSNGRKSGFETGDFSVINRFTRCSSRLSRYKKLMINVGKVDVGGISFMDPHYLKNLIPVVDSTGRHVTTSSWFPPEIENERDEVLELNHYKLDTLDEYMVKCRRGDVFFGDAHAMEKKTEDIRDWWLKEDAVSNEVENLVAYDFFNGSRSTDV